ncbi:hypothetical protein MMC21_000720 [Puttea exsequens]|nr:hypothetical protein [Puttea exsequens]
MNPATLLTSQGWHGPGHSLNPLRTGALTKPLSIAQKRNGFGIGKKQHDAHADQWWARAFDETLKGINATKVNDGATERVVEVTTGHGTQGLAMASKVEANWVGQRGLYSNFVKGQSLSGTLTPEEEDSKKTKVAVVAEREKKRKRRKGEEVGYDDVEKVSKVRKSSEKRQQEVGASFEDHRVAIVLAGMDMNQSQSTVKRDLECIETRGERRQRKKEKKKKKERKVLGRTENTQALSEELLFNVSNVSSKQDPAIRRREEKLQRTIDRGSTPPKQTKDFADSIIKPPKRSI